MASRFLVGTAGWSVPREHQPDFAPEGTHLERYAARLPVAELNASFYRPHRPALYAKWAASTPADFRFAVKLPKTITHTRKLVDGDAPLDAFLAEVSALEARLGALLVQLPPSLALDATVADAFLGMLRDRYAGAVVLEPRHASWFTAAGTRVLVRHRIARVAADPARVPAAAKPGGHPGVVYYRWHGSPRIYYSPYDEATLDALAKTMRRAARRADAVWCIFDNTASGAALRNALDLLARLA